MSKHKRLPVIQDCEGCGVCCMHMGYPAFMDPADQSFDAIYWNAMPHDLRDDLLAFIESYKKPEGEDLDGACYWFDWETRRCKHHQYRPRVCRDFEIDSKGCQDWRQHYADRIISHPA